MPMKQRLPYTFLPFLVQSLLIYGLNHIHTIHWCALFFSLFTLHILYIAEKTTIKNTFGIHSCSILINMMISINDIYYIQGQLIQGLYVASYLSVFLSLSLGLFFFSKIKKELAFPGRYFLSCLFASFVDGLGMMLFFIPIYTMERVLQIFAKEVSYKAFYTILILATVYGVQVSRTKLSSVMKKTPRVVNER